jgi:YgiT-type zinc finger domain-containing protein
MNTLQIKTCPMCGSKRIRLVKRDIESTRRGRTLIARDIEVEECPDCGERLFSLEAMELIESQRPHTKRQSGVMKPLSKCPLCGSHRIERGRESVELHPPSGLISVPDVEFDHCHKCGEKFFDSAASEKLDASVAVLKRRRTRRKSA